MNTDLAYATVGELSAALNRRKVSAVELTDAAIARIEKYDGAINAVVVRDFERAREAAKRADGEREKDVAKPLLGIPMTVKEANNVAGLKTTWGVPGFRDVVASDDGVAIKRLKDAGVIILGKVGAAPASGDPHQRTNSYGYGYGMRLG